jgi:hypothetical protein
VGDPAPDEVDPGDVLAGLLRDVTRSLVARRDGKEPVASCKPQSLLRNLPNEIISSKVGSAILRPMTIGANRKGATSRGLGGPKMFTMPPASRKGRRFEEPGARRERFIGTHLVDGLLEEGHRVRGSTTGAPTACRANPKGAEYVRGELGDLGLVREALEDIEVVFHFVNTTIPKTSNDDPVYDVSSNLVGTLRFLESCVQAGVRKVVFASSGGRSTVSRQRCPSPRATPRSP